MERFWSSDGPGSVAGSTGVGIALGIALGTVGISLDARSESESTRLRVNARRVQAAQSASSDGFQRAAARKEALGFGAAR